MCMITLIPANVEVPVNGLTNGGYTNDDGHGYAIASAHLGMDTFKSMVFEDTLASLLEARAKHGPNSVVLFHSRWATHGEYGEFNIHPFKVDEDTVMAHNGIMPSLYVPHVKDRRSDTQVFVDWEARAFCNSRNGVPSRRGGLSLAKIVGGGNKLAFLSVKSGRPAVRLVNSHLGYFDGGVWYSNSGYKYAPVRGGFWNDDWKYGYHGAALTGGNRGTTIDGELITCPMCYSEEVDEATNFCLECDFCLDCQSYLDDGCYCYVPEKRWTRPAEVASTISSIEDCAEGGWVKVDGVWMDASVLVRNGTAG